MNIQQWLCLIPDNEVKQLALKRFDANFFNNARTDIYDLQVALCCAFNFSKTPEGFDFWLNHSRSYRGIKAGNQPALF